LAGFQVIIYGRFWVFTEDPDGDFWIRWKLIKPRRFQGSTLPHLPESDFGESFIPNYSCEVATAKL
jgi:hypothetical protein